MPGILVTLETKYAWNAFQWGPDMTGRFHNLQMRIPETPFTFGSIRLNQWIQFFLANHLSQSDWTQSERGFWKTYFKFYNARISF